MPLFHAISYGKNTVKNESQEKPHPSFTGIFKANALGRLYTAHLKQRECFYLRILLVNVPRPTTFKFHTRTHTFRELQLLEDDNQWDLTFADAALTSTPHKIRQLIAIIFTSCAPLQAQILWENYKYFMTENIFHPIIQTDQCQNIDYTSEIYNEALLLIIIMLCHHLIAQPLT